MSATPSSATNVAATRRKLQKIAKNFGDDPDTDLALIEECVNAGYGLGGSMMDNANHIAWARCGRSFSKALRNDEHAIADLICDLGHLAEERGFDFLLSMPHSQKIAKSGA